MTRTEFIELTDKLIYLDGATGSNLVKAGMPSGVCPEQWILEHKNVMLELQKQYVAAGTDILYAPTFTANRIKLAEKGLEKSQHDMIRALVEISREAASTAENRKVYIAGDITMTGRQLAPMGNLDLEELIHVYKEQIRDLCDAGVDLLVVETMMSLAESRAALIAAKEVCDLPVMVTMTFETDGRTLYGTDAKTAAIVLESLGACAVGVNCSTGPAQMKHIIEDMYSVVKGIPIIAKPNAGLPYLDEEGHTCYSMSPYEFASEMKELVMAGATILGGCCGTNPDYIKEIKKEFGITKSQLSPKNNSHLRYLTSERQTIAFGLDDNFVIVGERINPTGKKLLQAELREGRFDKVLQFAEEQEAGGAGILDINMGMSGIDEMEMMLRAIEEVSTVTNLPLAIDSSHIDVIEAALRHYPGRALINSISFESEKFEKLIPLAKKYGAMFILLPLSDKGLPENLEEKKDIIQKISQRAYELGLTKEDIVVDGLVTTIGANKNAAKETLETIRFCKANDFATICGLSNISFGMPERSFVNSAFLTLAIEAGLTMAIANPSQQLLISIAYATDLLLAKPQGDEIYINYVSNITQAVVMEKKNDGKPDQGFFSKEEDMGTLKKAVLQGNKNGIREITVQTLQEGKSPQEILDKCLLPAINEVGDLFDKGKYFLPQLISGAEAMKNAIEVLEPLLLKEQKSGNMPTVVIATVEGDIHDIGKNLVALMLKNYGYKVIDLGKDVPKEIIVQAAKDYNADIIALSALMTTTMQRMRDVISLVHDEKIKAKVMIGGAVITEDYAKEIGADGYSKDATEAVRVAGQLIKQ